MLGVDALTFSENGKAKLNTMTGTSVRTTVSKKLARCTIKDGQMTVLLDASKTQVRKIPSCVMVETI